MSSAKTNLNDGPVRRQLLRVSAPMSVGIFSVLAIGLADAFFLARAGDAALAAVGFVYPVIVAVSAFSVGLSAGANTTLSQARGAETDDRAVGALAFHACTLGLGAGLCIALALWLSSPLLFGMLGAREAVLNNVLAYLPFWAASFPILVLTMILNAAFRAAGDGLTPASIMVFTAVLNIGLNPVLIFGFGPIPELGMGGAGLGTLIARSVAVLLAATLAFRWEMICIGSEPWRGLRASAYKIVGTALPAAASRAINPVGLAAVTAAVATLGDTAVAGFGAASRVQAIALVPFFALAAGLGPVVGQAWGAKDKSRARAAMRSGALFCFGYGAVIGTGLVFGADWLAQAMTAGNASADYTANYLRFVGFTLAGYGLAVAANAAMTGRSRAGWAMGLSLARIGVVYIPSAWIGVFLFGYSGVLAAAVLANLAALWGALVATYATQLGPLDLAVIRVPARALSKFCLKHD